MLRHRLRFLLHELDLPLGVTTIGRGDECHLTVDDPLVSRRHVRIVVGSDQVVVEDLNSRNGVLLNGAPLHGTTRVHDGDRLRVGAQEFVLCEIGAAPVATGAPIHRATAELRLCACCRLAYPLEVMSCPACGESEQVKEDTDTGLSPQGTSSLDLLAEGLERAVAAGRRGDAQRLATGGER